MATPKDLNIDPEKIKKLTESLKEKNYIMDPHGRSRRGGSIGEMPYTARGPLANTDVNHCQLATAGGMSACYACHYSDDKSKIQCQRACGFFEKSRFHERCMWETYGEFCWSIKAQDAKKAKGF